MKFVRSSLVKVPTKAPTGARERVQAGGRMQASEAQYRLLVDSNPHPMWVYDMETLRFVTVNGAAVEHYGYSEQQFLAMTIRDIRPAEDVATLEKIVDELRGRGRIFGVWRHRKRDGSLIDAEISADRIVFNGRPAGLVLAHDVTERRRADQLLRLEHMVASSLATADSGSTALQAVIRAICEAQGWECGRYLQVDEQAGVLRCSESWHVADNAIEQFIKGKREAVFGPGVGLAGRAWQSGHPTWVADIKLDPHALQVEAALKVSMHGAFHFPVMSQGKTIGVLAFNSRHVREPDERLLQSVHMIGSQIGQFMVRMAQQEHIARLNRVHAVLSGIKTLIVRRRNRQELFDGACRIAVEQGNFGIAWIGRFDPDTLDITPVAWAGLNAELLTHDKSTADSSLPRGQGGIGRAIRERKPIFENDMTIVPERGGKRRKEAIRLGYRSLIVLPLIVEGAAVGSMSLFAKEPNFFTEDELKLLTELAGDISFALEHIGKEERIARLNRIQAVMSNINSMTVRVRDRQELFNEACRIAVEHGGFGIAWIAVLNPETLNLAAVAWSGDDAESLASTPGTGKSLVAQALREKRAVFRNDIAAEPVGGGPRRQEAIRRGYRSFIGLPLLVEGTVVANISLFTRELNFFTEEEVKLLTELAGDISFALEHIAKEEQLQYLAYYDNLTGLPNRTLFIDRMNQQLHARSSEPRIVALVLLDLERFRIVNETMGRHGGDELLRQVAQRLEHAFDGKENLARVSANGYGVIMRGARDAADVAHAVENQLLTCFREPYTVNGTELRLAVKAGIALFPTDGGDSDTLFRNAEAALKKAKSSGDRYLFYAAKMNERAAEALSLETRLRKAVEGQQFVLHYQPKIELASGRICGLEALIRWNDPDKGLIPPLHFIPLLEETGLIIEVGKWALEQALGDYRKWVARGYDAPRIAVNVSSIQLRQKDFAAMVSNVIGEMKAIPHGLDIEITESLLMEDIEGSIEKLKSLREMGINIAIDDFGTGYSSLGYLARLPVNALKIDRSFIIAMGNDADSMAIVSTIISLGHSLKMKVIAEGVETEDQSNTLKLLRCDEMQGYLFSKPLPGEIIETRYLAPPPSRLTG